MIQRSVRYLMVLTLVSGLVVSPAAAMRLFQRGGCSKSCTNGCVNACLTTCPSACKETVACECPAACECPIVTEVPCDAPHEPIACESVTPTAAEPQVKPESAESLIAPEPTFEPVAAEPVTHAPAVVEETTGWKASVEQPVEPAAEKPTPIKSATEEVVEEVVEQPMPIEVTPIPEPAVEPMVDRNVVVDRYATPVETLPAEPPVVEPAIDEPVVDEPAELEPAVDAPIFGSESATEDTDGNEDPFGELFEATPAEEPSVEEPPVKEAHAVEASIEVQVETPQEKPYFVAPVQQISQRYPETPESPFDTDLGKKEEGVFGNEDIESAPGNPSRLPGDQGSNGVEGLFGPDLPGRAAEPEAKKAVEQPEAQEDLNDPFAAASVVNPELPVPQSPELVTLAEPGGLQSTSPRTWTDKTATHQCQARLVRVTSKSVILARATGEKLSIPFARMAENDLHFVRHQLTAMQIVQARATAVEQLATAASR